MPAPQKIPSGLFFAPRARGDLDQLLADFFARGGKVEFIPEHASFVQAWRGHAPRGNGKFF